MLFEALRKTVKDSLITISEAPKPELPKFDKAFMDYVEDDAQQWLETVMEIF